MAHAHVAQDGVGKLRGEVVAQEALVRQIGVTFAMHAQRHFRRVRIDAAWMSLLSDVIVQRRSVIGRTPFFVILEPAVAVA